jgi:hypothetical protein
MVVATVLHGAVYYVSPDGDDSAEGTADRPLRTIQRAVARAQAGDVVQVRAGFYEERVATVRSGTGEQGRITFNAEPGTRMLGWRINHAYITVRGFEIRGWSAPSKNSAYIEITRSGDYAVVEQCMLRDGIVKVCDDAIFSGEEKSVRSQQGGFVAAGFRAGQTLHINNAAPERPLLAGNVGTFTIVSVTDNEIRVDKVLADQGPVRAYLTASYVFGLLVADGAEGCRIESNVLSNLGYDAVSLAGLNNVFQGNLIERCNGWDALNVGGTNILIQGNVIWNSPLAVYQVSPDVIETGATMQYSNVVFRRNMVLGFQGIIGAQKGAPVGRYLVFEHNVFMDVGGFVGTHPFTIFRGNTFVRVSRTNTAVTSARRHALQFDATRGATNILIVNNVFFDSGQWSSRTPEELVGWYEILGPADSVVAVDNAVMGGPPSFAPKKGWPEGKPELNGGNPGFADVNDVLGPDGVAFTEDDGLRLLPTSPLVHAGANGRSIGAYMLAVGEPPRLQISRVEREITLQWPDEITGWRLQAAPALSGPWESAHTYTDRGLGGWTVAVESQHAQSYYRLAR